MAPSFEMTCGLESQLEVARNFPRACTIFQRVQVEFDNLLASVAVEGGKTRSTVVEVFQAPIGISRAQVFIVQSISLFEVQVFLQHLQL